MTTTKQRRAMRQNLANKLLKPQLKRTTGATEPWAILVAGQPGAGKSTLVSNLSKTWLANNKEGLVHIDPDWVRQQLYKFQTAGDLAPEEPTDKIDEYLLVSNLTNWEDSGRDNLEEPEGQTFRATMGTVADMVTISVEKQRNLLLEGTFQNTIETVRLMGQLRELGYKVAFHCMATNTEVSLARVYYRNELELQEAEKANEPTMHYVDERAHDEAVVGIGKTVKAIERQGMGEQLIIHCTTHDNQIQQFDWSYNEMAGVYEPAGGGLKAGKLLVEHQEQLTTEVARQIEATWKATLSMLEQRYLAGKATTEEYQEIKQTYDIQQRRVKDLMGDQRGREMERPIISSQQNPRPG